MSETLVTPPASSSTAPPSGTSPPATGTEPAAGGGAAAKWYETLTDKELAADTGLQRYENVEALAKGYKNLEKRFGIPENRRIDLPEDLTKAEDMRPVWTRLGAPEKVEGYIEAGLKMPDGATDGDKGLLKDFIENVAHKNGMPANFAKAAFDWWAQRGADAVKAGETAATERRTAGEAELKTAFGQAYDTRHAEIVQLLGEIDPKGEVGLTKENLVSFPKLAVALSKIVDMRREPGGEARTGDAGRGDTMTPAQAKAAVKTLEGDPIKGKALNDRDHAMHKDVVKERSRLLAIADGRAPP